MIIYPIYLLSVAGVVYLAIKAAQYANIMDQKTNMSGAFIGVIILAIVTSMPEVFTSVAAITIFDFSDLPAGNVLGSNLFNITIVAVAALYYRKKFQKAVLSSIYSKIAVIVLIMYILVAAVFAGVISLRIFRSSIVSPIIIIIYIFVARIVYSTTDQKADEAALQYASQSKISMSGKKAFVRLMITGVVLLIVSAVMTYSAGMLTRRWGIEGGFGGAIFLGIATSVPELTSFLTLFKVRNYDIAVGSMIGSNMFNFTILAATDMIYRGNVFLPGQMKAAVMVITGLLSTALFLYMLLERNDNKKVNLICPVLIIGCYIGFLLI